MAERLTSNPPFWNERYAQYDALFGTAPNAFVREQAEYVPHGARVAEVGAGEARNALFLAAARGARVTAIDFSEEALRGARRQASQAGVLLETAAADVRTWQPAEPFDALVVTFLHLLPEERAQSYRRFQEALKPGGVLIAEWFAAQHADKTRFAEIGPSKTDRLVAAEELRQHFPAAGIAHLEAGERTLSEGPVLRGQAATLRFIWAKPAS